MKPVSHAERIAKRHARKLAANANTSATVAPGSSRGPSPDLAACEPAEAKERSASANAHRLGAKAGTVGDGPRDEPGATRYEGEAPNPFAQFMGCAP